MVQKNYGATLTIFIIIVLALIGLGIGIYFLIIYFKDGPERKYPTFQDLAIKNKDIVDDINFSYYNKKDIKYYFNLGNNPTDVVSNKGQIYYDTVSKNLITLTYIGFFTPLVLNSTQSAVWTISYTYNKVSTSYNVTFINLLSTVVLRSGDNDIVINNYQVTI